MSDIQFIEGVRFYKPNDNAPDFVITNGVINKAELLAFLQTQPDEFRFNVKMSKGGNFYGAIDTFEPTQTNTPQEKKQEAGAMSEDGLPF